MPRNKVFPGETGVTFADIQDALEMLKLARFDGDLLKIALREASLNDLLDRYQESRLSHLSGVTNE